MGILRVLEGLLGAVGLVTLYVLVLFVLPLGVMLYVGLLFPQTGQWRKRWRGWKADRARASHPSGGLGFPCS